MGTSVRGLVRQYGSAVVMAVVVVSCGILALMPDTRQAAFAYWGSLYKVGVLRLAYVAFLLLLYGVAFNSLVEKLKWGWLEWSLLGLKANAVYAPLKHKWSWFPWLLLLGFCVPIITMAEEVFFRYYNPLGSQYALLWGGLIFGMLHVVAFTSIRMCIYLMSVGAIFVILYAHIGLSGVFVIHASYDYIALVWVIFELRFKHPLGAIMGRHERLRLWFPATIGILQKSSDYVG